MLGFLLVALAMQAPAAAEPVGGPRHLYQNCPGQDVLGRAANVEWGRPVTQIEAHRAFRAQLHAGLPEGPARILWYATGGDLATTTFSVVVVRRADGIWHVNGVGQTLVWIQGAQPTPMPRLDRDLSSEESRQVDALLADPCLYAGPTFLRDPNVAAGGLFSTLEIETPTRRWIGTWHVLSTRQESDLVNLIARQ